MNFTEGALVKKGDLLFQIDPRPYQALVNQAKSKIAQDQAQLTHNTETYKRIQQLRQRGAASQEDLDKALADREGMQAALMADTADLETKQFDLDFTRIDAPISGRVSRYEVTEGNVVQSGQNGGTLLTTMVSVDPDVRLFRHRRADSVAGAPPSAVGRNQERARDGISHLGGAGR